MRVRRRILLATAMALPAIRFASASDGSLPPIGDLGALSAESARLGVPVIVLFSTPGCPFCREARESYLAPRLAEQRQRRVPEYLLREVDITSRRPLGTLDGQALSEAQFAERFDVRVVPVLIAFDPQWRLLGDPLVGIDRAGFYESYLERLIIEARRRSDR